MNNTRHQAGAVGTRRRRLVLTILAALAALAPLFPVQPAQAAVDVYTTPGKHSVNGREWHTWCEDYSSTIDRCFTEILSAGRWVHNNITYLPAPRDAWGTNPLANNRQWTDQAGRKWKTECDTAWTGANGCRSQIFQNGRWVFNNIVQFGATTVSADTSYSPPTAATPTPASTGAWPNASNTGVPAGVTLSPYTGPLTITAPGTVIKNKVVTGTLRIQAANVQIVNTRINGSVDLRDPRNTTHSFTITDSEVHIGDNLNTGLMRGNFKANRVEVTGGRRSMYCQYNCVIENSWVHSQGGDPGGDAHFSGIRMEQNGVFRHNTITCEAQRGSGTGCSAGLTGYGDFAPVQNNLVENNYFYGGGGGRSTVCAYGGSSGDDGSKPYGHQARDIRFVGNVFEKGDNGHCGNLGTIKSFDPSRPGNVWSGNTWDNGSTISYNGR
ncbi:hypothetical protein LKO27_14495 [Tessaracoccus sp. OS52]|uniref:hypothetical protein n=1 Tax=Tessaracoccus sp. OS52 TaxID=2886691 RepID=UPI001D11935E|nr:hypothetical protein [Tessaracoccus sp. OS52]MCC2594611.1 hypothetical protein [Tessaracoccus sp. OS52]